MIPPLASTVLALCRRAASAILEVYGSPENAGVTLKADRTPVTAADRAAHRILAAGLTAVDPSVPVLSEEGEEGAGIAAARAGTFWLVDPLDGTKEFLKRTGEFTVNVARIENGRPVLGVVLLPATGRAWVGDLSGPRPGAWRVEPDDTAESIRTTRATPGRIRLAASRDHGGALVAAIEARGRGDVHLRRAGSSLKFCLVAQGDADLYVRDGRTMEWDTGAADCVLEAAGGRVVSLDGRPLRYGEPPFDNPSFVAVGDPTFDWNDFLSAYRDG